MGAILDVQGLKTSFATPDGTVRAVSDLMDCPAAAGPATLKPTALVRAPEAAQALDPMAYAVFEGDTAAQMSPMSPVTVKV